MSPTIQGTQIIPLGGVGEFGANATIIQTAETCILVDCGLLFPPDKRQPGVDIYVHDPALMLKQFPNLSAVFLTHGHEDHIGGLGFLLEARNVPVVTMPYTAQLIRRAMEYHDVRPDLRLVSLEEPVTWGDLEITFIGVTHSIAQACALAIKSSDGTVIHSGDFKVDPLPGQEYLFQSERFKKFGEEGVDLLIMDSTNATKQGFCPSEEEIMPSLEKQVCTAPGRVFFTTFSSHMPRVSNLVQVAKKSNRKICFLGRSFRKHFKASVDTAFMAVNPHMFVGEEAINDLADEQILFIVSGSQAEPRSALTSIARGGFRGLRFQAGDRIIFSSKAIPGNERQIMLFASDLERMGVEVVTGHDDTVHTSGHGYREDLAYLLNLTQPRYVAPIHGEFHQLMRHHEWLLDIAHKDTETLLLADGNVVELRDSKIQFVGQVETHLLPIDGNQNLPLTSRVLRERKDLMYTGMVLVNVNFDEDGPIVEVDMHGVCEPEEGHYAQELEDALYEMDLRADEDALVAAERIRLFARSLTKRQLRGKPIIKVVYKGRIRK